MTFLVARGATARARARHEGGVSALNKIFGFDRATALAIDERRRLTAPGNRRRNRKRNKAARLARRRNRS